MGLLPRLIVNICLFSPLLIINADQIEQTFDILATSIRRAAKEIAKSRNASSYFCGRHAPLHQ